ncbi:MAG TPA: selenocysteine-specific translation elongation factor [Mycobacteriales bacterium]|nr:selenocysteine-specific translation elongation factor [Mycobacteriales bacterium]
MHVLATAGHVDHGKSTLVRALTGMEPDRWAEEKRRGMTIDLGFAWSMLPSGVDVAFVDVPGHERFLTNMLAGVGPVPAVMFIVAADEGWQAQSEEHLRIADALQVRHAVVAVTKADRGDAQTVAADVVSRFGTTSMQGAPVVPVSAATGDGLDELRGALDAMVALLPAPAPDAPVRLWVDRAFTIRGAGTVVTGTLPAGVVRVGDELCLEPGGRQIVVRGLESMKHRIDTIGGVARVALNLRGVDRDEVARGMALTTPGRWTSTDVIDAACVGATDLPRDVVVHIGAAAVPARCRRLGGRAVRLHLSASLPLHLGDRLLIRDPASRSVVAADVADLSPQPLHRRGQAAALAQRLHVPRTADDLLEARGEVAVAELLRSGLTDAPTSAREVDGWWVPDTRRQEWLERAAEALAAGPVELESLRRALGVPTAGVLRELLSHVDGVRIEGGLARRADDSRPEPPEIVALVDRLDADPLAAPDADELASLDRGALRDAARRGRVLHLAGAVYVGPGALELAVSRLRELPSPFSVSDARQALGVSRRVAVPLLEHLDARRRTRRLPDGTRIVVARG